MDRIAFSSFSHMSVRKLGFVDDHHPGEGEGEFGITAFIDKP